MATKYIMTTQSKDQTGLVAALTTTLAAHEGFINELAQFGTPTSARFYSRICFTMDDDNMDGFRAQLHAICKRYDLDTRITPFDQPTRTLIMVSKFDHCLNDLLYRVRAGSLKVDIAAIVSNHETHRGLAEMAGLPFHYIPIGKDTKPQAEAALRKLVEQLDVDLIVLARYMQILSDQMCQDYSGRIINIHHSFLPSFKGAKPYHRAFERGVKLIGATAHYVTADLDEGPIIEQSVHRVDHTMEPQQLVAIGRDVEARTLARAVKYHVEHRAFINGQKTVILP